MDKRSGTPRSQRQQRIGELIRHSVADVLLRGEIRDPIINQASVTVTEVSVSPDLKNATAWVMPLGGNAKVEVEDALNNAASYIRGQVSRSVTLKYTPKIKFKIDQSFDQADRVSILLNQPAVRRDITADRQEGDDDEPVHE